MTAFDRDKLRDELAKHDRWSEVCSSDEGWHFECSCELTLPVEHGIPEARELFAAHQADVALAWVEAQMSEERNSRIEPLGDRAFGSVWYRRLVTDWGPVEGGGK